MNYNFNLLLLIYIIFKKIIRDCKLKLVLGCMGEVHLKIYLQVQYN